MLTDSPITQIAEEKDPDRRLLLLEKYASQLKPDSAMWVFVYPLYYNSYMELKNFRKVMEYADKLLALGDRAGASERYGAFHVWSFACNNIESDDITLAAKALTRSAEGIEVLKKIERPACERARTFEADKKLASIYLRAAAGAAAMKMKDYSAASDALKAIIDLEQVPLPPTEAK